eukprot:scaffold124066_cov16-Tisochrysis_lutea.AAC.1
MSQKGLPGAGGHGIAWARGLAYVWATNGRCSSGSMSSRCAFATLEAYVRNLPEGISVLQVHVWPWSKPCKTFVSHYNGFSMGLDLQP